MIRRLALGSALAALPGIALAFAPGLPTGAVETAATTSAAASYDLALGPWTETGFDRRRLEGPRSDRAWRIPSSGLTTLQILAPLRDQILAAGYSLLFECETDGCGGFDFRYETDTLPEPAMHVDLGDFRFLSARRGADHLALLVSRSSESGFIQITEISDGPIRAPQPATAQNTASTPAPPESDLATALETEGRAVLEDLQFDSGSTTLGPDRRASLAALAAYLAAHRDAQVALVGHTDTDGGLAANIALSQRRAEAVRNALIADYGVTPGQVSAEGAGWLAPRATNMTPEGRLRNRRVEAVLTTAPQSTAGTD